MVAMDAMYPIEGTGRSRPFLIMVDHLGRFAVISRMNNHKPDHVVDLFYKAWVQQLGRPSEILADRGPAFIGASWVGICDLMDMQMLLIPRECPYENGMVERSVGLLKISYRILKQRCPALSDERLLLWSAMGRDLIPNTRRGMSPSQIMLGRSDATSMLESRNWLPESKTDEEMSRNQDRAKALIEAKEAAI